MADEATNETTNETVAPDIETPGTTDTPLEDTTAKEEQVDKKEETSDTMKNVDAKARQPRRGNRRYTPYNRNNRAVYHQSDDSDPSCRVYVGNLAWEVTWKELKDHMVTSGCEVIRADILASPDGRSKGCGIVEFATADGAQRAILLNDTELMGRQIFVREDRESGNGGGYYTQQPGNSDPAGDEESNNDGEKQSCRVYVGNLSWDVAWQDLKDHMRDAGDVVHAEVMTESDGRSKGCGIVEFSSAEAAKEACTSLTDTELKGRMIFVREDRETSSGGRRQGGAYRAGGGGGGGASVYVGNLAYETSWQDLKDHMRQAGNVDQANILQEGSRSKGCGIVVYQSPRDASRAIRELQNSVLHGRPIFVREDREGGRRGGGGNRGGGGGGAGGSNSQLFVNNLSYDTSREDLEDHFSQCAGVERVEVIEGPDGRRKGFGTVKFSNPEDAQEAIKKLNGLELDGRDLEVRYDNKAR